MIWTRIRRRRQNGILSSRGAYSSGPRFRTEGNLRYSTRLGKVRRCAIGEPVSTSTLASGIASTIERATRIVRVMCPSPNVSWEYIAMRGEVVGSAMTPHENLQDASDVQRRSTAEVLEYSQSACHQSSAFVPWANPLCLRGRPS